MSDKITELKSKLVDQERPSRTEAEDAVRTLIRWVGDDPAREGLVDTPKRLTEAFADFFTGYEINPDDILKKTFAATEYVEPVILKDIRIESFCEHHILPIIGKAHIAYIPSQRVVGLSKLARVVEVFSKRLQIQEQMTVDIAKALQKAMQPKGVAVAVEAEHYCMSMRGVQKPGVMTLTTHFMGDYADDANLKQSFLKAIGQA